MTDKHAPHCMKLDCYDERDHGCTCGLEARQLQEMKAPSQEPVIKRAVDRFLGWKLPQDFAPDNGISFKREGDYDHPQYGRHKYEPIGTNLFTADQARAMFEYCLEAAPSQEPMTADWLKRKLAVADDGNVSAGRPCDGPNGCNSHNCIGCGEAAPSQEPVGHKDRWGIVWTGVVNEGDKLYTHPSDAAAQIAFLEKQLVRCKEGYLALSEQLAESKKLCTAISRDCNNTANERNELRGQIANQQKVMQIALDALESPSYSRALSIQNRQRAITALRQSLK